MTLLTPGPCQTSPSVRMAAAQDMNHREPAFLQAYADVRAGLSVLAGGLEACLISGSGTASLESMLIACTKGRALCLIDGYYSRRAAEILDLYGFEFDTLEFDWLKGWDLDQIEEQIETGKYETVVCCHHETTVGRLNDLEALAGICKAQNLRLLVDAMSSFGADPLPKEGVTALACTGSKCLRGLPGLAVVMVEPGLELNQPKSWFLNLERYRGDNPPITAPVQSVLALRQALVELGEQGGLAGRHTEVLAQAQRVRSVLRSRGYDLPIRDRDASCTVTLAEIPQGKSWQEWNDACLDAGFVVFGCKEHLKEKYFQISTMGEVPEEELDRFIAFLPENSKPYPGGSKIPRSNWEVEEAG